jgi:hypothetical protein
VVIRRHIHVGAGGMLGASARRRPGCGPLYRVGIGGFPRGATWRSGRCVSAWRSRPGGARFGFFRGAAWRLFGLRCHRGVLPGRHGSPHRAGPART